MNKNPSFGLFWVLGAVTIVSLGWGWDTHRFINRNSVYHLPGQMQLFIQDSTIFANHAADADQRRVSGDTSFFGEAPRHFMDIDDYPQYHSLPHSLDTLIALYGWERVKQNGTNPWATLWFMDSLVTQLRRGDWTTAALTASDLGHYAGDAHQPLHNTRNYNGQYSGQTGIHSRYESTMLSTQYYLSALTIAPDSARYVADRLSYIFSYILHTNSLVDTILQGDLFAKATSGWNGSGSPPAAYYTALWQFTRRATLEQMQNATRHIADLWYTAWVDAGLIVPTGVALPPPAMPMNARLSQNYPNPFNPTTTITYHLDVGGTVDLTVYAVTGRAVRTLVHETQSAGDHAVTLDGSGLSSGVYLYTLRLGTFFQTQKMIVLR